MEFIPFPGGAWGLTFLWLCRPFSDRITQKRWLDRATIRPLWAPSLLLGAPCSIAAPDQIMHAPWCIIHQPRCATVKDLIMMAQPEYSLVMNDIYLPSSGRSQPDQLQPVAMPGADISVIPPPRGITSNFDHPNSQWDVIVSINTVCITLTICSVVIQLYTQRFILPKVKYLRWYDSKASFALMCQR